MRRNPDIAHAARARSAQIVHAPLLHRREAGLLPPRLDPLVERLAGHVPAVEADAAIAEQVVAIYTTSKNGKPHVIPLSPLALQIIGSVPRRGVDRDHLFGYGGILITACSR